jgi:xylulokinase
MDSMSPARVLAAATGNKFGVDLLTFFGILIGIIPSVVGRCNSVGRIVADLPSPSDRPRGVPVFCCSHGTWRPVVATHEREAGVLGAPTVARTGLERLAR